MPPKRREQTDKNKEDDNMPELEELQAADDNQRRISVQGMVDRIEGQSHGQPVAKRPAVPHVHTPDKDVADLEEASKVMAEGIMVYVKAVVSHITQSTNQRKFQHKVPKQGVGSSGAGDTALSQLPQFWKKVDWAVKMRIRPPEFETSICDAKYHVSLSTVKCRFLYETGRSQARVASKVAIPKHPMNGHCSRDWTCSDHVDEEIPSVVNSSDLLVQADEGT
ncbi:hypothetical protein F511_18215 [Dorcoceras hygrometricum]|uniref:Uncharacterized protein n=1 Tax=Dorcoceras hygrometricum TaxID=472368 RepID=A0A2Z7BFY9_9LAMI|nr:hypothetical protein F511_18215 [Dorcoceras hygrometricum]